MNEVVVREPDVPSVSCFPDVRYLRQHGPTRKVPRRSDPYILHAWFLEGALDQGVAKGCQSKHPYRH